MLLQRSLGEKHLGQSSKLGLVGAFVGELRPDYPIQASCDQLSNPFGEVHRITLP